jgi:hypothetical protein
MILNLSENFFFQSDDLFIADVLHFYIKILFSINFIFVNLEILLKNLSNENVNIVINYLLGVL